MTTSAVSRTKLRQIRDAVLLVASTGRAATVNLAVLSMAQAATPFLAMAATKGLLDAVAGAAKGARTEDAARRALLFAAAAAGVALGGAALRALAGLAAEARSRAVADRVLADVHARAAEADLDRFDDPTFHDALHRATQEAPGRAYGVVDALLRVGRAALALVASGALLAPLHGVAAAAIAVAAIPAAFARLRAARELDLLRAEDAPREREAAYVGAVLTGPAHAKEVRAFALGPRLAARAAALREALAEGRARLLRRHAARDVASQAAAAAAIFGAAAYAAREAVAGRITVGEFALYAQCMQAASGAVAGLVGGGAALFEQLLPLEAYRRFVEARPRVADPVEPAPLPPQGPLAVALEDVVYAYPGSAAPALTDLRVRIKAGERVAVVGANGAGKSTLVRLLCRLADPDRGVVRIGDLDVRTLRLADLRRRVAPVFQDFARYEFTLREILALGAPEFAHDDARLRAALAAAGAEGVLGGLPDGLDARLGGRFRGGRELSVGEWQKIALARALVRESGLLVLDEPASALDARAESDVAARVLAGPPGPTVVLVSHRWATVAAADRALVLERGRLVEDGPPAELLRRGGAFARLFGRAADAQGSISPDGRAAPRL